MLKQPTVIRNYRLIIFDVDGILSKRDSGRLLPHAVAYFNDLASTQSDFSPDPFIALAANQGGVGLRRWMEQEGFGEPHKYPTQIQAENHIYSVARHIEELYAQPAVYISFAYQSQKGNWSPLPPEARKDPRWKRDWRKPAPGMLIQAMADAGVTAAETLMVSDDPAGRNAAVSAGCEYIRADLFFPQLIVRRRLRNLFLLTAVVLLLVGCSCCCLLGGVL